MNEDIALGMKLRRLLHAFHARDLRQHLAQQAGFVQQLEGPPRMAFGQHLGELIADALARYLVDLRGETRESLRRSRLR